MEFSPSFSTGASDFPNGPSTENQKKRGREKNRSTEPMEKTHRFFSANAINNSKSFHKTSQLSLNFDHEKNIGQFLSIKKKVIPKIGEFLTLQNSGHGFPWGESHGTSIWGAGHVAPSEGQVAAESGRALATPKKMVGFHSG